MLVFLPLKNVLFVWQTSCYFHKKHLIVQNAILYYKKGRPRELLDY